MRKLLAALLVGSMAIAGGVACDDASEDPNKIDEDDGRVGPGDGKNETGPGR